MRKIVHLTCIISLIASCVAAQTDSVVVRAHAAYDSVSNIHRSLFGENFRKEWAAPTKLPVIRLSEKGLIPLQRGGGHQTHSLRMKDAGGKEWVLRSIEKYPEILLPEAFRETFAADWVRDAMSAQNPYAPLIVPVLADAVHVPHTNPVIGWVAPDKNLGEYEKEFANTLCLLEEREPGGNSDNTAKMLERLDEDNDNTLDTVTFFRARMLDLFMGDWDRHEDQWRWLDEQKGSEKKYLAVPRDRDQALYRNEGVIPSIASRKWLAPFLKGFKGQIKLGNEFFFEGRKLNDRFFCQIDHERWAQLTQAFIAQLSDPVLEAALARLPEPAWKIRHDELLRKMKERRSHLAKAMDDYYYFLNRIVDIKTSDKNELVTITGGGDKDVLVTIDKLSKNGKPSQQLFSRSFDHSVTREIRIYTGNGNDSVLINTTNRKIKTRIIGVEGHKAYNVEQAGKRIKVYDRENDVAFWGHTGKLNKRLSNDSANTAYLPANPYNIVRPLVAVGYNLDDGFLLGGGVKYTRQGFRKLPWGSTQQVTLVHSFSTSAFRIRYRGEWLHTVGSADVLLAANVFAPNNTTNFFGRGNETVFDKTGNYKKYYRTRYNWFEVNPSLRWHLGKTTSIDVGPSFQYYHLDSSDNKLRFITNEGLIHSYDSASVSHDRSHAGLVLHFLRDKRNSAILTSGGSYMNIRLQGYTGLNSYSKSFIQLIPEFAVYKNLGRRSMIVIAERLGGAVTLGKTAFYQSAYLGGQENLLGYRQYRFAGDHMLYNNLEFRVKLANFASYILPGQFGLTGFYDAGRVWQKNESSEKWHQGVGGGFYFAPAQMMVIQLQAGYSAEGWYPYFFMGFRF